MTGSEPLFVPSTDDVTVAVHDLGGDGPPLVFCHATGFHGRVWLPVAAALANRYHCWAIDLRGHGDSVIPEGLDLAWSGMARDVMAVVDALKLGSGIRAAGWSMGGCALALAELARPGMWSAAWAFEPIIFPPPEGHEHNGSGLAAGARRRRNDFSSRDEAFDNYASKPPFSLARPDALRSYVDFGFRDLDDGTVTLKCPGPLEAQVFEGAFTEAFARAGEVASPFTVVASGDGQPPAAIAPTVAELLPRGTLERMDDLTHFGPLQDPDRIAESIAATVQ